MKDKPGDKQRLLHILFSIAEIEGYVLGTDREIFLRNSMMKYACAKQIEIIGEAAYFITKEFKVTHSQINWEEITGIRHILVHEYFGIDFNILWQVITEDLTLLKSQIKQILNQIE